MKFWDSKDASERNLYNWRSQKHEKKKKRLEKLLILEKPLSKIKVSILLSMVPDREKKILPQTLKTKSLPLSWSYSNTDILKLKLVCTHTHIHCR